MRTIPRFIALLAALSLAGACGTTPPARGRADLLTFIADGTTPRSEAITRLGEPSRRLQDGRICAWRIGHDAAGQIVAADRTGTGWFDVDSSLVLVFDDAGVLARHALIPMHAP